MRADVNAANTYGTPLFDHARVGNYDICRLLMEHGADVNIENYAGETALFGAADKGDCDMIKLFLEHGADPCHHTYAFADSLTPLLYMLRRIDGIPEQNKADAAELLVKAQREQGGLPDEEWKQAQNYIAEIGHTFNLYKDNLKENRLGEREAAMTRLYTLFDTAPAAPVIKHNGQTPIAVDGNFPVDRQHQALWEYLVPASGKCVTMQGEVIRITGRVAHESKGNGGVNWDTEYQNMLKALILFLEQGKGLDAEDMKYARQAICSIYSSKACGCWKEIDKLKELAVKWVRQNPTPILRSGVNYRR